MEEALDLSFDRLLMTMSKRAFPACCGTLVLYVPKFAGNALLIFVLIKAVHLVGATNCLLQYAHILTLLL